MAKSPALVQGNVNGSVKVVLVLVLSETVLVIVIASSCGGFQQIDKVREVERRNRSFGPLMNANDR